MRTNAIIRIILYSIAILILISILATALLLNTFVINTDWDTVFTSENSGTVTSVGSVPADSIRDIQIEWAAGTITIMPGDVGEITFSDTAGLAEKDQMIWSQKGDKLLIQFCKPRIIFGISIDAPKDLKIIVPRGWNCDELDIDAVSADVNIQNMTIQAMDFDSASGTCTFTDCHLNILDVDTASGDINFSGTLSELDCDAASATCTMRLTNCPKRMDADMASGDLRLTLPENCGFTVNLESLSGDFTSEFPTATKDGRYVHGDGSCIIQVSAMSGNIVINKGSAAE